MPQVKKEVRDIEKTFVITGWVERWGRKGFGVGVSRYKLFLYRVDKQQGPIVAQGTIFNIL